MWLASDKVAAAPLRNEPKLKEVLNGLVGLTVKAGSGAKYLDLVVLWLEKDEGKYPGVIWSYDVRKSYFLLWNSALHLNCCVEAIQWLKSISTQENKHGVGPDRNNIRICAWAFGTNFQFQFEPVIRNPEIKS